MLIIYKQLTVILISILMFCINELIELVFIKLAFFSKHKYLTTMNRELTTKIF